jgi:serine phosphatase RsbU (regulator of sigma subunit)/tetratricopeptide (TPR) repeat protein
MEKSSLNYTAYPFQKSRLSLYLLILLYCAFSFYYKVFCQNYSRIDSLKNEINNTKELELIPLYSKIGFEYAATDPDKAQKYVTEILKLSKKLKSKKGIYEAQRLRGYIFFYKKDYNKALEIFKNIEQQVAQLDEKLILANLLNDIGKSYAALGEIESAISSFHKSLDLLISLGEKQKIAEVSLALGQIYADQNKLDKAQENAWRALSFAQKAGDKKIEGTACVEIGYIIMQLGEDSLLKALKYYNRAIEVGQKYNQETFFTKAHIRKGQVYLALKEYQKAIDNAQIGLIGAQNSGDAALTRLAYSVLSEAYRNLYSKTSEEFHHLEEIKNEIEKKSTLETQEKQKEIEQLSQENLLKNTLLSQKTSQLYLSIAAIILFVFLSVLLFFSYREKNRMTLELQDANKSIKQKNAELEIKRKEIEKAYQRISLQKEELEDANKKISNQNKIIEKANFELKQKNNDLLQANENIKILTEIGQKLTQHLDFESIFEKLHSALPLLMKLDIFGVYLYDDKTGILNYEYNVEKGVRLPPIQINIHNEKVLAAWCIEHKRPILIKDYERERQNFGVIRLEAIKKQPAAIIYIPLFIEEKVIGCMTVQSFESDAYNSQHLEILKTLGIYAAIAIDNARIFNILAEQKKSLERANQEILSKNVEIQNAYEEIRAQNEQLEEATATIIEQNRSITDSIQRAKFIQEAMLSAHHQIQKALPYSFVLFKPQNIVSGDFYWMGFQNEKLIVAAADCTGHGVPGALLTMLGATFLNRIILENKITSPSQILNLLNKDILINLNQLDPNSPSDDGMEIAICVIDTKNSQAIFAGAKRPLFIVRNNQVLEYKNNNFAIGRETLDPIKLAKLNTGIPVTLLGQQYHIHNFEEETIDLTPGDMLYLFSDGFVDQKKPGKGDTRYKTSRFKQFLIQIHQRKTSEQLELLNQEIENWRGEHRQIDDILVIGLRV